MTFIKGHKAWNKGLKGYRAGIRRLPVGFKHTKKTRKKMREAQLNYYKNGGVAGIKGKVPWNKGKKGIYHKEYIQKLRDSHTGKTGKNSSNWKGGITKPKCEICGKIITYRCKRCSKCRDKSGKNNPKWRGGRNFTHEGYVMIYKPEYKYSKADGYILEHRYKIQMKIGN